MVLLAAATAFVLSVLLPAYWSPNSRVFASRLGYPSLMRLLGRSIEVQAEPVQRRPMVRVIAAEGATAYLNEIPIHSEVPGIVTRTLVEAGQKVQSGEVILHVNPGGHTTRMFQLRRQLTQWELDQAKLELKREQQLYKQDLTSKAALDQAVMNLRRAQAASRLAMEEYAHTLRSRSVTVTGEAPPGASFSVPAQNVEIVATVDGTVIRRNVQLGENLIELRTPLLVIGDRLVFRADLDQRYSGLVQVGDAGRVYLRARPGVAIPATVLRVGHVVETAPQRSSNDEGPPPFTFAVWMSIPPSDLADNLLPGMNGYAVFERAYVALAVPERALMRYSGRAGTVLTVDASNRLQVKAVTYTGAENGWVAIESADLREGDLAVVNGQTALRSGDQVALPRRLRTELQQANVRSGEGKQPVARRLP